MERDGTASIGSLDNNLTAICLKNCSESHDGNGAARGPGDHKWTVIGLGNHNGFQGPQGECNGSPGLHWFLGTAMDLLIAMEQWRS